MSSSENMSESLRSTQSDPGQSTTAERAAASRASTNAHPGEASHRHARRRRRRRRRRLIFVQCRDCSYESSTTAHGRRARNRVLQDLLLHYFHAETLLLAALHTAESDQTADSSPEVPSLTSVDTLSSEPSQGPASPSSTAATLDDEEMLALGPSLSECGSCGVELDIPVPGDHDSLPVFKISLASPDGRPGSFYLLFVYTGELQTSPLLCGVYFFCEPETATGPAHGSTDGSDAASTSAGRSQATTQTTGSVIHEHAGPHPWQLPEHQTHELVGALKPENLPAFEDVCRGTHRQPAQGAAHVHGDANRTPAMNESERWVHGVIDAAVESTVMDSSMIVKED